MADHPSSGGRASASQPGKPWAREVSPEMVEAALDVLMNSGWLWENAQRWVIRPVVEDLLRASFSAKPSKGHKLG